MGVTPEMIADKRDVLACNLLRAPLEVWPAAAGYAGYVDLWVADPGSTERLAPPYPLLADGQADDFTGEPLGVSQRGDVITIELPGANLVYGGVDGAGQVQRRPGHHAGRRPRPAGRVVGVRVRQQRRLRRLPTETGPLPPRRRRPHRRRRLGRAAGAVQHGQRPRRPPGRSGREEGHPRPGRTARSAAAVVALFSECHKLFGHPGCGQKAADLATQVLRRGRKAAVTLAFDTQSSRADAIPPRIVELVKINACFAVKAWRSNDGFLGDGSFQAGIRATELRPGKDVGTSIVTGATPERFEIVKWFYIQVDDDTGYDAATVVITRAVGHLDQRTLIAELDAGPQPAHRDLLEDLVAVLGEERVPAADVPARLRDLAPDHHLYRGLTGIKLREILERDYGIRVASTGNRYPVDPTKIRACIARRAADGPDDRSG